MDNNTQQAAANTPAQQEQEQPQRQISNFVQDQNAITFFNGGEAFAHAQRVALALSRSTVVPKEYQNNVSNCLVALELANRLKDSPLMVMQNMDIIHGRPGFKSVYVIAKINSSGRFAKPLQFRYAGAGQTRECTAYTYDHAGNLVEGITVSMAMAKAEGWIDKTGSKWKTMPELMLCYRAAAFFGRINAPEIATGMPFSDELQDFEHGSATIVSETPAPSNSVEALNNKVDEKLKADPIPGTRGGNRRNSARNQQPEPAEVVIEGQSEQGQKPETEQQKDELL